MSVRGIEAIQGTIGKITGTDITGNRQIKPDLTGGFPSTPSRDNTLDEVVNGVDLFGSAGDYGWQLSEDFLPDEIEAAEFFNTRQDLTDQLPSTGKVNRWNAQSNGDNQS